MKKRALTLLLSAVLALTCFAMPVYADDDVIAADDPIYDKFKGQNITLNVYNWGEYISDGSDESLNINREFEKRTGIKVLYSTFASNEELYAKLKSGGASYDVIIPSDYMASRMIKEDMVQPINYDNVPNFKYIMDNFKNPEYDPENRYTVPYTWGTVGIIYNTTMVDEADVNTWDVLWNAKYFGDILMFSNSRDAFGISLKRLGYSFNTENPDELREACDALKEQKSLVQAYVMDEIFDKMQGGEAALAPYYAGDAIIMIETNPDLAFSVPEEGTNRFVDAMCIPKSAQNKEAAELYINFMCETEVALANCDYIGYSTPHSLAYEELDDEVKNDEIAYPSDEVIAKTEIFINLSEKTNKMVDGMWTEILSANTKTNEWFIPVLLVVGIAFSISLNIYRRVKKNRQNV